VLHLHRAARADVLAGALAQLLADPPADPFAAELVAVPTRGMERWLAQTMSAVLGARDGRRDGVCANVLFPTPHRLIADAVAVGSGVDPDTDPWLPERLVWPLLDVVDESLGERWLAALATYLGATEAPDPIRRERRLSIVRHLAGLFDRYALHRPEMLEAWAAGRDSGDAGGPLPDAAAWQAELWRRLRARVGIPGPAERRASACARLIEDPALAQLPPRLTLFGLTRLPSGHLQVLRALAAGHECHLFLLHPSPALWDAIASGATAALVPGRRRANDHSAEHVANRLLSSWGRDAREMQLVLAAEGTEDRDSAVSMPPREADTLLARLQADIQADRAAPGAPLAGAPDERAVLATGDHSVIVHSCHGRVRQVEVLRDAILHTLAQDESLEPRDVIVMCPDVESFAPLIQATFGAGEAVEDEQGSVGGRRAIDLRVRLADRSLTQTNPVLGVVATLLELVDRRLTASEVLDLADRGPVRRRFGLDDEDLTRLQDWITQAGIRWGLDAAHREPYRLSAVHEGTWQAGVDRLLLGVTMTEDDRRLFGEVLPLDDVDSRAIELAGRLAELIARLGRSLDALGEPRPLADWAAALAEAADALTDTAGRDRWQRAELQRILDELVSDAGAGDASDPPLAPAEVRSHLAARLAGRPTRANFRTGHLTVCTLMPMRSVPHRVVCLLGLDDGAFPRHAPRDGDDLMLADPHIGERDPRSEDRQLLLDALMAATERVIITYTGNDERTNSHRPPAVPVGELLDAIDASVRTPEGAPARERVVVCHPLQPFDPRNFEAGELTGTDPWSFDDVALGGARALTTARHRPPPFLTAPLHELTGAELDLDDLVAFAGHPVRAFLRRRLEISMFERDDEVADGLPIELDPLQRWDVANRLLEALLHGTSLRVAAAAEKARGSLPPGALGDRVIDDVKGLVIDIATAVAKIAPDGGARDPIDVRVRLPGGRLLSGTVTGVTGTVLLSSSYSRVSPRNRIAAWIRLLALSASHPEEEFAAATVGRGRGRDDVRTAWIPPLAEDPADRRAVAVTELERLVDLYERGMREPLPLYSKTSAAWAETARPGAGDPRADAEKAWQTYWNKGRRIESEDADLNHQLVLGAIVPFAVLLEAAPADGESGDGWAEDESSRLGRLARRLWDGLLDREQVGAR
jgi:exodeoxyribonuclease V gamma subunit